MRRIIYAASFMDDTDAIAVFIESRFGRVRADAFIDDIDHFCELVAANPDLGRVDHGYDTTLYGVVHGLNWLFFQYDSVEIRFVHIVDGRRNKPFVPF